MGLSAFHNDPALRAELQARLTRHCVPEVLKPSVQLTWDGATGSLVGCLIESDDVTRWVQGYGLPAWLAQVLDPLSESQPGHPALQAFGAAVLDAIAPGADLEPGGSRLILALLDDLAAQVDAATQPDALTAAVAGVRALHQASADGQQHSAADWKAARRLALQATDALTEPSQRALASCAETAAWDPARSSSCVFDTITTWRSALADKIIREFGWTDADDKDMEITLRQLYETYLLPAPDLKLTVFDLLEEHYPEKAFRLREYYRHQRESGAKTARRATDILLGILGSTQVAGRD